MKVRQILKRYDIKPSKFMDQHFILDEAVLKREVEYADISGKDTVLEIGAGVGNLTKVLAQRAKKVIAIEKDQRLCEVL